MSRTHIRKVKPELERNRRLEAGFGAVVLIAVLVIVAVLLHREPFDRLHATARGTILDARIVETGARDSAYGGRIVYRIEALVRYTAEDGTQERWVPVVYPYSHDLMVARLAHRPEACEVFWTRRHPENAKCRFYHDFE